MENDPLVLFVHVKRLLFQYGSNSLELFEELYQFLYTNTLQFVYEIESYYGSPCVFCAWFEVDH